MNARTHRVLMTIGSIAGGMGSVWTLSEVQPLGIPAQVGAASALISAIIVLVANSVRANFPAPE